MATGKVITEDQSAVIELLASSGTYGGVPVERIDTHTAVVFLAGPRAWKLKRAVRFDYLDFSTVSRRRACCEAEVRLNRRTAPALYRGVVAITRESHGTLALGGTGTPVDWVVEMNRFDQQALLDRLADGGRLTVELVRRLGRVIAQFHGAAEERRDHGGPAGMAWVIEGNAAGFAEFGAGVLEPAACVRVTERSMQELGLRSELLEARRRAGFVRQCHGDLHLRNIVLLEGAPTLFDAVEFNDEIACIDVLYDLAFLLMDLWKRRLTSLANAVWNAYLAELGDFDEGISLMPLFLSCRAAIRSKTSATAARVQPDAARARELQQMARDYLAMAERLLTSSPPVLVAVGGFSGTGKSTLAAGLAASLGSVPGAVVFRSDELRKRLRGAAPHDRLGADGYMREVSDHVYETIAGRAGVALRAGYSVIADAVYARPEARDAIEQVAATAGVPFAGFWLEAPESTLVERVRQRRDDASDAGDEVIRMQRTQGAGAVRWRRLDASAPPDAVSREARGHLPGTRVAPPVGSRITDVEG